jgi:hypothetical protein
MRERFPGYYTPSAKDFKKLWQDCLFLPDANILLHLFRYASHTTAQVLDTLERLKPRVWIPYRVGFEFHRRWRDVDQTNRDAYDKLSTEIETQGRKLSALFNEYTRHQTIDAKKEQEEVDKFVKQFLERIEVSKTKHPKFEDAEAVLHKLSDLIGDAVGPIPSAQQLADLEKEGKRRYESLIPPGFRDAKKDGADAYGDYFIWQEALDKAKEVQKPIIMITDDVKADWWLEFHGKKIGPRPELVAEMKAYAGQPFYLYTLSQFLDYATGFLDQKIDPSVIREIKLDEVQLRNRAAQNIKRVRLPSRFRNLLARQRDKLHQQLDDIEIELAKRSPTTDGDLFEKQVQDLLNSRSEAFEALRKVEHNLQISRSLPTEQLTSERALLDYMRARAMLLKNRRPVPGDVVDGNSDEEEEE